MIVLGEGDDRETPTKIFDTLDINEGTNIKYDQRIKPICAVDSAGKIVIPAERSAGGQDRLVTAIDSAALGKDPLNTLNTSVSGVNTAVGLLNVTQQYNPYDANGGTAGHLLSKTIYVDSDAGGAIGSVALLAAGGAGVKWVIAKIIASGFVIATIANAKALMTLSDAPSDNANVLAADGGVENCGPFKQATANTAMNLSCAGGGATPLSRFPVSIQYWAGA